MISSRKGFWHSLFWSLVWLAVLGAIAFTLYGWAQAQLCPDDGWRSWRGYCSYDGEDAYWLYMFLTCVMSGVMGLIVVGTIWGLVYGFGDTLAFEMGENGVWHKATKKGYSFPAGAYAIETLFNRVLRVEVDQSTINRLFDVGTVRVHVVTFVNAEIEEHAFCLSSVLHPNELAAAIMWHAGKHEGMDLRIEDKPRA